MSHDLVLQYKCRSCAIYTLVAMIVSTLLLADDLPIRINMTASMPRGAYLLRGTHPIHAGDFVMVCLDDDSLAQFALQRGYLSVGYCANSTQHLLKQVAAKNGDLVKLKTNAVIVNGISLPHSTTLNMDSLNRSLPAIRRGIYILNAHQLWLYGTESAKSWDSRYFGIINTARVVQTVKPLLVWSRRSNT